MRDRFWVVSIASGVLVADQATKALVTAWIPLQSRIPLVDSLFALTHVRNRGAAFGLFSNAPAGPLRAALIVVSILAVALIWAYAREGWHERRIVVAFGMILGGAIGNLVDRLRLGYVVDFLDMHWGPYHWPSFNVADAAITLGAVSLFVAMTWYGAEADGEPAPSGSGEGPAIGDRGTDEQPAEDAAGLN